MATAQPSATDSETETERAADSETETEIAVDSETETECSVCHEQYTKPKLLPCAHVLCRHCLVSWLSSSAEHQCPLCRCAIFGDMEAQQTDRGNLSKMVDSLPTYATLATLIKCMRILSQDHMCGGCQQSAAVSICLHCSEMMCSFCQNVHKRFAATRHHKVEDLATMTAERLAASQLDHCAEHEGNPSQFFCQSHRKAFCSLCAMTKHRSCSSVTELEKAAGKSRDELTELLSALLQGKQSIEEAVSELDRQIDDIEKHSQRTITEIDKLFDQLENSLKTRRKRVKNEELKAKSKAKNSALAVKTLLLDQRAKLISNHRVVSCVVKSSTDQSLCEISPSLKAQIERLNTSSELPPHTEPVVEVTYTIDPKAIARIEQTVSELCQFTLTPTTPQSQDQHQILMPRWRFQPKHGQNIKLSEDRMTAEKVDVGLKGIVVADQAMMVNELFEVQILSGKDPYYFPCGAVLGTADGFTLPDTASHGWDPAVVFSHQNFICGREVASTRKKELRLLPKDSHVGVMLDSDRHLHLFIDGQDTDVIDWKLPSPCFAFFQLIGYNKEDSPKGGENDESIGTDSITTGNAQRTMINDQLEFPCACGRRFTTKRGMKIHRTKMGCLKTHTNQQQRTAIAGETLDDQGQELNHSAKDIHADGSDADFAQALNAKRGKLNLPPAGAKEQWEKLDEELVLKLNALIGNSTLEHKLDTYGDII